MNRYVLLRLTASGDLRIVAGADFLLPIVDAREKLEVTDAVIVEVIPVLEACKLAAEEAALKAKE